MTGPRLSPFCTEPGCGGTVEFVITEGEEADAGFECWICGAKYMQPSERGEYDALLDLEALIVEEMREE